MKMYEGRATKKWLALAASSSSRTNECTNMAAAAFITAYSESAEAAVAMFTEYHREMNRLLAMPSLGMEQFNEDEDPFQVQKEIIDLVASCWPLSVLQTAPRLTSHLLLLSSVLPIFHILS